MKRLIKLLRGGAEVLFNISLYFFISWALMAMSGHDLFVSVRHEAFVPYRVYCTGFDR
jgi:hypothetical protein